MHIFCRILAAVLVWPAVALAQTSPPKSADRTVLPVLSEAVRSSWQAVGVVNYAAISSKSLCTGALVAADMVLTAAHCVIDHTGKPRATSQVHFLAGWDRGKYAAHGRAAEIILHPAYATATGLAKVAHDVALIRLETPVAADAAAPLPIARTVVEKTDRFAVLGYHQLRPHIVNGRFDCPVLGSFGGSKLMRIGCNVIGGNSGGPLLRDTDEGWQVVGVVVAKGAGSGPGQALAVPIGQWVLDQLPGSE